MTNIQFFNSDLSFFPKQKIKLRLWLNAIAAQEKQSIEELNYIFCSDKYLHDMNFQFLQHDDYTDVITFENTVEKGSVLGEIYISYDRIRDNAKKYNGLTVNELHRVMAHGLLHLLGYKDKTTKDKALMTVKEDFCLNLRSQFGL